MHICVYREKEEKKKRKKKFLTRRPTVTLPSFRSFFLFPFSEKLWISARPLCGPYYAEKQARIFHFSSLQSTTPFCLNNYKNGTSLVFFVFELVL